MPYIAEDKIMNPKEREEVERVLEIINSKNRKKLWLFKRFVDIIVSVFLLIFLLIPMLLISIVIFLEDGHNPFFCQTRVGRFGKEFKMYKFRTMVPNAEELRSSLDDENEMTGPVFKMANDPRITRVGRFLRKTSLDELPQFINVLLGDMTIIGPRPPLPMEVKHYTEFQKIRLIVTPGITCIWQVTPERNSIDFDEWVKMDIDYVMNRNLWLDLKIMFRTVYVMFCCEGQ